MSGPADEDVTLDVLIAAGTSLLGIPLAAEWRAGVRQHLAISMTQARLVADFPLPDEAEPASVFRA